MTTAKKPRPRRSPYKFVQHQTTVSAAVGDAMSELQSLRDELTEWKENLEEKLSHTDKYSQLEDAINALEEHCDDDPDVPKMIAEMECTYTEMQPRSKRRGPSRARRCENAVAMLQAATDAAQEVVDDEQQEQEARDACEALVAELEEVIQSAEGVEFPTMYG